MNVLINAYAVSPNHGSEPGVGWNLVVEISKYCVVHVITEAEFENEILLTIQNLPHKSNINFYFNDIGEKIRNMCWNQGDYRFYYYYNIWQKKTFQIALEIIKKNKIDIIHQLNMIGFREPGYLWKINNIPFVWGPVGGYVFVKRDFLFYLGFKETFFYSLKNIFNYLQAKYHPRVRKAINRSKILYSASNESYECIIKFYNKRSLVLNEAGLKISSQKKLVKRSAINSFNILWVGRFIPTKMLKLALEVISILKKDYNIKFHIVGSTFNIKENQKWLNLSNKLGIDDICIWHGRVPHLQVQELMRNSDLLLFTSIVEGTSHVVLESIANSLPIVCFDTCGHSSIINDKIGVKISISNPKKGVSDFVNEISYLIDNPEILSTMSENCKTVALKNTWESIGFKIYLDYLEIIN